MKKILLAFIFLLFYSNSYALNESCFEYRWNVSSTWNEIFLLNVDKNIDYAKNEKWKEVYMKLYSKEIENLDYDIAINANEKAYIKDKNKNTFFLLKVWENKSDSALTLDFKKIVWPWVNPEINIYSLNYYYKILISEDNVVWSNVSLYSINTLSFRYLKLEFFPNRENDKFVENLKIIDLIFSTDKYKYLFEWKTWETINLYSNFYCSNEVDYNDLQKYTNINWKESTKFIYKLGLKQESLNLEKNIVYSLDKWSDIDWDWVLDNLDNCKNDYNPNQLDTNTNWIWDICDDDDIDWIIWKNDNCPFISNRDQKDVNNNWVWDVCEFDKDKDTIFDSVDNCINIFNKDQTDSDNDWIWNVCDNCKLYNPTQFDKNINWIWDVCEEAEKMLIDNDADEDWIIDSKDNCKESANPDQRDGDNDWIWDKCDNCKDIKNTEQYDLNKNLVGDMCEDSDNDWILGYLDNCINEANPDQKDSDNDWIWDICEDFDLDWIINIKDNCEFEHNVDQKDIDNDWEWDKCDKEDNRFIESNKYFFIWLIFIVVLLFATWISIMFKKLNKTQK